MSTTITFNVQKGEGQTREATFQVEDKKVVNSILGTEETSITEAQYNQLQAAAKNGGDLNVLEFSDLNPNEKIKLAEINNYNEFYDIKLSGDGKYYEITVKPTSWCYPDPRIEDLKKDFGLKENVFLNNNMDLVDDHPDEGIGGNYDNNKIKGGTTFRVPIEEASFTNGPAGFWRRLF